MLTGILKLYSYLFTFVKCGKRASFDIVWKNPIFEAISITIESGEYRLSSENLSNWCCILSTSFVNIQYMQCDICFYMSRRTVSVYSYTVVFSFFLFICLLFCLFFVH